MKLNIGLAALPLALVLAACGNGGEDAGSNQVSTAAAIAAPVGTTWNETVSKTPAGGFVMGNPNAPVKLIEYGALSCSHCAEFAEKSDAKLNEYIAKGTVSFEFRNFLLNSLDIPAALLARCSGPGPYFQISHQMFAAQKDWLGKAMEFSAADQAALAKLTPDQLPAVLAAKIGLDSFVQQRGVSSTKAQACLADKAAVTELTRITADGQSQFNITGTPTFIINGAKVEDVADWEALEPKLRAAGA